MPAIAIGRPQWPLRRGTLSHRRQAHEGKGAHRRGDRGLFVRRTAHAARVASASTSRRTAAHHAALRIADRISKPVPAHHTLQDARDHQGRRRGNDRGSGRILMRASSASPAAMKARWHRRSPVAATPKPANASINSLASTAAITSISSCSAISFAKKSAATRRSLSLAASLQSACACHQWRALCRSQRS